MNLLLYFQTIIFDYRHHILLATNSISLILKVLILGLFLTRTSSKSTGNPLKRYLIVILFCALFEDIAWIATLLKILLLHSPLGEYLQINSIFVFLAWACYAIQYQALALFIEKLVKQTKSLSLRQKISILISSAFSILFMVFAFMSLGYSQISSHFSLKSEELCAFYSLFCVIIPAIIIALQWQKKNTTPRIIKRQSQILITYFVIPRVFFDLLQYFPFSFVANQFTNTYAINGISTLTLSIALFYCTRKVIGLRFLNLSNHVESPRKFNFIDGFKEVLEQLSRVTNTRELGHITQTLFKEAFRVPLGKTTLYIRACSQHNETTSQPTQLSHMESMVESFIASPNNDVLAYIYSHKILIHDEIEFSHFYETQKTTQLITQFLETINADIFLPIYKHNSIIAYIIIERYARTHEFYSDVERDEMLVFASYVANIINLLQHRNLESMIAHEKEISEELYKKHQEINQYKESMRSFLRNARQQDIGIIFYKQRKFIFANQAAQEMVKINPNLHAGHPLAKALKQVAQRVEEYHAPHSVFSKDARGNKLIISGVPHLERNNVIITVCYPDFADVISHQIDHLQDPSKWDYLLYLETTKPGQLINQLIPGCGETLLNIKIKLLDAALSKKALVLEMAQDDLMPTVELLHHLSMRETLHTLSLPHPVSTHETTIKLFGINPLFGVSSESKPLLERLNETGTLFIQTIEHLDIESQELLAEYLKYGYYRAYKSDVRRESDVRIICSTNKKLSTLVQEGTFSAALLNELKNTSIAMPSLLTIPDEELGELAQGYGEQAITNNNFKNLFELTEKDKHKIATQRPTSLIELKNKVQQLLLHKSKKNNLNHEIYLDPAYEITDPDLAHAARLGKHALRDQKTMTLLWDKFRNQNKIATFLGVNRSSVSRRCNDYGLVE